MTGGRETILPVLVVGLVILTPVSSIGGTALSETTGGASAVTPNVQNNSEYVDLDAADLPGNGTEADPYRISNVSELQAMEDNLSAHYVLVSDIDASVTATANGGMGFDPIGGASGPGRFTGSFDGQGHTIRNLTINRPDTSNIGLFSRNAGNITSVYLDKMNITGGNNVGGVASRNDGLIKNVSVNGSVSGDGNVGGLVGINLKGTVQNASADVSVTGEGSVGGLVGSNTGGVVRDGLASGSVNGSGEQVGGLVGSNTNFIDVPAVIQNSTASASVTGESEVGGLVGRNEESVIQNATASGNVTAFSPGAQVAEAAGGLVGLNQNSSIQNVSASGSVSGSLNVGGLVGTNGNFAGPSFIQNATASGSVTGNRNVGGLVGKHQQNSSIQNASATGSVTGSSNVGGLVGHTDNSVIRSTFATGNVTGGSSVGGLVGDTTGDFVLIQSSYWDTEATGQAESAGNATALTTAQMQGEAARENMSALAFGTVWETQPDGYPVLIGVPQSSADEPDNPGPSTNPVTGETPTDPNGDGLYEDVNGNGQRDIGDVQALFALLTSDDSNNYLEENTEFFDFNGNGRIDIGDVQALFTEIVG